MTQNEFNVVLEQQYRKCADVLAHKKIGMSYLCMICVTLLCSNLT